MTMNSKSSSVTWGIPLSEAERSKYAGSMLGAGSMPMITAMAALCVAAAALGMNATFKKKKASAAEDEE
jgi:hypothetical protein